MRKGTKLLLTLGLAELAWWAIKLIAATAVVVIVLDMVGLIP